MFITLETDGILSFVLPKSFLNCSYYDKTRKLINKNFQMLILYNVMINILKHNKIQ